MNAVDPRAAALESARVMVAHQASLAGKAEHANVAMQALKDTAKAINTHAGEHADWAFSATQEWGGKSADTFDRRAGRVGKSLDRTEEAADKGATIVAGVHTELVTRHRAVTQLIDEYVAKATPIIASGSHVPAINVLRALLPMRDHYLQETTKHLATAQTNLKDAAKKLLELERAVERDGFADPGRKRRPAGSAGSVTRPQRSDRPARKPEPAKGRTQPTQPRPAPAQPRPQPVAPRPQPARDRSGDRKPRRDPNPNEGRQRPETPPRRADPNPNEGRQRPGISPEPESKSDAAQGYDIPRGGPFSREYPRARPPGR